MNASVTATGSNAATVSVLNQAGAIVINAPVNVTGSANDGTIVAKGDLHVAFVDFLAAPAAIVGRVARLVNRPAGQAGQAA